MQRAAAERLALALKVAVAVNPPPRWFDESFGASLLVGLSRTYALSLGASSYRPYHFFSDSAEPHYKGAIRDLSLGVTYFPRSLWSGLSVEVGGLARFRDLTSSTYYLVTTTATRQLGAQALVGWSWHLGGWAYVAVSIGGSLGYEQGQERRKIEAEVTRGSVSRFEVDLESSLRFGLAFD